MKTNKLPRFCFRIILATTALGIAGMVNAGTPSYRAVVLADAPIVYYELDETSGTTAANSATTGATYTGTFNTSGGSITVNQASFAQGGTAYDFGGGIIAAASALVNSLDEWTVEAWVNYDSARSSSSNFLSNDQGGWNDDVLIGFGPEYGLTPAGTFGVVQQGNPGTTRDIVGSGVLTAGQWYYVVVTGSTSAGALTVFVDGVEVASDTNLANGVTFNGADGFGTANLTLGASRPDGLRPYDGLLDEVAVYDKVLDTSAITSHLNAGISESLDLVSITSITRVGADLWQLTLEGAADTSYELRSSTTLDFSPGTLVEPLTAGDPAVGTIGGTNDSVVTTDGDGDATVRMTLAGPENFVRAQIPPPLFSEDFEADNGGFTFGTATGSDWEWGAPDTSGDGGTLTTGNDGSDKCWATVLGDFTTSGAGFEGFYTNPTTTVLRSPVIDLSGVSGAELSFAEALDLDPGDTAEVYVIDDATDTEIDGAIYSAADGNINAIDWVGVGPIALPAGALGKEIYFEWRFSGQADSYSGWYIDDVVVAVP